MQASKDFGWKVALALLAAVGILHAYAVWQPVLVHDDFQILAKSVTWLEAYAHLWTPHNEHAMPLGRVSTWVLLRVAGDQSAWPHAAALHGIGALFLGLILVYLFVRWELGHPFYGLLAAILFGVSAVYQQAVSWFAASFSVLTFDTLLLALLAAQSWRRCGRGYALVLCGLWCGLAPGWFASGILAGPLCALYLVVPTADFSWRRSLLAAAAPLVGSVAFLAFSLPRTAQQILHTEHYQGQTAMQAFGSLNGVLYSLRSVADNLLLGSFGISLGFFPNEVNLPLLVEVGLVVGFLAGLVWWWRPAPPWPLLVLGFGLIGLTYFLTYGTRAQWPYLSVLNRPNWSRYHLLPQFGLTLLLVGGLARRQGRWFTLEASGAITRPQAGALLALIGALLVTQFPRAVLGMMQPIAGQHDAFQRLEQIDARCREHGIAADLARQTLGHQRMPGSHDWEDGGLLLRGSAAPRVFSVEEARGLLHEFAR